MSAVSAEHNTIVSWRYSKLWVVAAVSLISLVVLNYHLVLLNYQAGLYRPGPDIPFSTWGDASGTAGAVNTGAVNTTTYDTSCADTNCTVVRIYTFVKDQHYFLRPWLEHHIRVFGADSLHVVDHESKMQDAVEDLRWAAQQGVNVTVFSGPFSRKGKYLSTVMHQDIKNAERPIDFIVPLDIDEILGIYDKGEYHFVRSRVLKEFAKLPRAPTRFKFMGVNASTCPWPVDAGVDFQPMRSDCKIPDAHPPRHHMAKTFYTARGFKSTDQGNHYGHVGNSSSRKIEDFFLDHTVTMVSYRGLSYDQLKAKMLRGTYAYGHDKREEGKCTNAYGHDKRGAHYCRWYQKWKKLGDGKMKEEYVKGLQKGCKADQHKHSCPTIPALK